MKQKKSIVLRELCHIDTLLFLFAALFLALFVGYEIANFTSGNGTYQTALMRAALLLIVCLLFYLGGCLRTWRTKSPSLMLRLMVLFFILYLYLLFNFTLLDASLGRGIHSIYGSGAEKRAYYLKWFVNLKPFRSIYEVYILGFLKGYVNTGYMLLNLLGNICAFMPFAFFLPLFFQKQARWYIFLPTVLLTVCAVELLQLFFMVGSCDIDDLILNVGGAMLLFLILKLPPLKRLAHKAVFLLQKEK